MEKLGLKQGDTLCIHSELFRLGEVLVSKQEFLQSIIDSFFQVIGNKGTLIMPTCSYSFNRYKNYDKIHTKSTMGILSEYFRTIAGGGGFVLMILYFLFLLKDIDKTTLLASF